MSSFWKKNWFIGILACLLAFVSVFYIYDTNKGKLKGKTAGGESVVYEINGTDKTASELYEELVQKNGSAAVARQFEKAVVNASGIEVTDEMKEFAANNAERIISDFKQSNPTGYEEDLTRQLKLVGYESADDLESYLLQYQKLIKLSAIYAREHSDELKVRRISYILIQFEDTETEADHPTADEAARMKAVDDALAEGTEFAEAAKQYSEDSSTSATGGVLGTIDINTVNLDQMFFDQAMELNEGEISDWVYSEQFGFFRIKNDASTTASLEALGEAEDASDPYEMLVQQNDTGISATALWEKAEELGLDFGDNKDLENDLKTFFGVTEDAQ